MASPSKKEGLRCKATLKEGHRTGEECDALLLEKDSELGLGVRCMRQGCHEFHPFPVLLSEAVKRGFLTKEAVIAAVSEPAKEKTEKRREEMDNKNKLFEVTLAGGEKIEVDLGDYASCFSFGKSSQETEKALRCLVKIFKTSTEYAFIVLIPKDISGKDHLWGNIFFLRRVENKQYQIIASISVPYEGKLIRYNEPEPADSLTVLIPEETTISTVGEFFGHPGGDNKIRAEITIPRKG